MRQNSGNEKINSTYLKSILFKRMEFLHSLHICLHCSSLAFGHDSNPTIASHKPSFSAYLCLGASSLKIIKAFWHILTFWLRQFDKGDRARHGPIPKVCPNLRRTTGCLRLVSFLDDKAAPRSYCIACPNTQRHSNTFNSFYSIYSICSIYSIYSCPFPDFPVTITVVLGERIHHLKSPKVGHTKSKMQPTQQTRATRAT